MAGDRRAQHKVNDSGAGVNAGQRPSRPLSVFSRRQTRPLLKSEGGRLTTESSSLEIVFSGHGKTKRFSPRRGVTLRRGGTLLQSMFTCARVPAIARFHTLLKSRRDRLLVLAALRARFLGRGGSINRR